MSAGNDNPAPVTEPAPDPAPEPALVTDPDGGTKPEGPEPEVSNLDFKASFEAAAVRAYKLEAILKAHNINPNLVDISSEGLKVVDGMVYGEVDYKAPQPKVPPTADPSVSQPITESMLDTMSSQEMIANWDEIVKVLEASK